VHDDGACALPSTLDALDAGAGEDLHPQRLQPRGHHGGNILVLTVQDVLASVDEGDRNAQQPHEGGHLDADDAAAHDQRVAG